MAKLLLIFILLLNCYSYAENYIGIRVYPENEKEILILESLSSEYSIVKMSSDYYEVILNEYELENFNKFLLNYEIFSRNPQELLSQKLQNQSYLEKFQSSQYFRTGSISGYHSYEEIYAEFDRMIEKFPDLIKKEEIGKSIEGRPIYSYCIGINSCDSANNKPHVLLTSLHHAREPGSVFTILYYLWNLFERYELKENIAEYIFSDRQLLVIPNLNPDGVVHNEVNFPNGGGLWRKNRRFNSDSTYGVDLNRNYGPYYAWNSPNNGSSLLGRSDTYRGTEPFSEPETQAIREFLIGKEIKIAANYHTFGNAVFYPFSYKTSLSPDSVWYNRFLSDNYRHNRYLFGLDADVINYSTRGSADDYMYLGDDGFTGFLPMTCEVGNPVMTFWPPIDVMLNYAEQNLFFIENLILSAGNNISIHDKDAIKIDNQYFLKLSIANIGYNDLNEFKFSIKSTDGKTLLIEDLTESKPLKRGDTAIFFVEYLPTNADNGDLAEFELTANLDYEKIIKFKVQIFEFSEFDLFDSQENITLNDDWHFFNDEYDALILKSNRDITYKSDLNSSAIFKIPETDNIVSRYSLRFEHSYGIEANYDFGLIFTKDINDEIKNPNFGEYLVQGTSRQGSMQRSDLWGFHGIFKNWVLQTIYLTNSDEIIKEFEFNLRTDRGNNKFGWLIKDLKLRMYNKKTINYIQSEKNDIIKLAPNPVLNDHLIIISSKNFDDAIITISDINGKIIFEEIRNIAEGNNLLSCKFLSTGAYRISFSIENKLFNLPLIITK